MNFINPIEILELENIDINAIDSSVIKRAKSKLFREIELSDKGGFDYKGLLLTKNECESVIFELENNNLIEFYSHLVSNEILNNYLVNGDEFFFDSFSHQNIYNNSAFIKFISPFFVLRFEKSILKAFNDNNTVKLNKILNTQILLGTSENLNNAFKALGIEIQNRIQQIETTTKEIKGGQSIYSINNIDELNKIVEDLFPANLMNLLPSYFQSQINKIAASINFLQLAIWDEFDSTSVPLNLLKHLLELNIESVSKPTFQSNYELIKKKHFDRIEQEKNAPTLSKWAAVLLELKNCINDVENNLITSNSAFDKASKLFDINELNSLPDYANEIRNQIGYCFRNLAIELWNKHTDVKSAISSINLALSIMIDDEIKSKFENDKDELVKLEEENRGILTCWFCDKNVPDINSKIKKTIYFETSRSRNYNQKRVEFSQSEVIIPRCKSCADIHSDGSEKHLIIVLVTTTIGALIGALNDEHLFIGGIIGLVLGWIISLVVTETIDNPKILAKGIKLDNESSLRKHPLLIGKMSLGWTFSKPRA